MFVVNEQEMESWQLEEANRQLGEEMGLLAGEPLPDLELQMSRKDRCLCYGSG